MSAYRKAAEVTPLALVKSKEQIGPRQRCMVCNSSSILVRACTGTHWFWRILFGGCGRRELHGHQRCLDCKAEWPFSVKEE